MISPKKKLCLNSVIKDPILLLFEIENWLWKSIWMIFLITHSQATTIHIKNTYKCYYQNFGKMKPFGVLMANNVLVKETLKQSLFTTSNMVCQFLRQKVLQKGSVMKTNSGVFIVFKTKHELRCQNELETKCVYFHYWDFLTNFLM